MLISAREKVSNTVQTFSERLLTDVSHRVSHLRRLRVKEKREW
jgi:hypothetical protein